MLLNSIALRTLLLSLIHTADLWLVQHMSCQYGLTKTP